jgi:hypothetical protein
MDYALRLIAYNVIFYFFIYFVFVRKSKKPKGQPPPLRRAPASTINRPAFQAKTKAPPADYRLERGTIGEKLVADRISKAGFPILNDVIIESGRGLTQIDHIVMTRSGIAVIETKHYSGVVYGSHDAELWTHSVHGKPDRQFQNPLRQNYKHRMAVERHIHERYRPVKNIVVFSGDATIAGGPIDDVFSIDTIVKHLATLGMPKPNAIQSSSWKSLKAAKAASPKLIEAHLRQVSARQNH